MAKKICGIYKITNTVTNDFYIGSSKNVKRRWAAHKWPSVWNRYPNKQLYQDMKKYGADKFEFEILAEVEAEKLKEKEQQFIEKLQPVYNNYNANGLDIERQKETKRKASNKYNKSDKGKEYRKSDKGKESHRKASNKYNKSDKGKEKRKEYNKSDKGKESHRKACNKYDNQLCYYNGETLTLNALSARFKRQGIPHPTLEAKKYLI